MATWRDGYPLEDLRSQLIHEAALPEDQLTTDRQRDRRTRILDAAVDVAGAGGYDRVHMRDIAAGAEVSVATLYHYFPSKVHVLVWALDRELLRFADYLSDDVATTKGPFARLRLAVSGLMDAMEQSDRVTEAMTHAYVASTVVASAEAEMIRVQTSEMFFDVMNGGYAPEFHRQTAELLTDIWTCEVLALVQGRRTYADMRHRIDTVIDLISRTRRGGRPV